MSNLKLWDAVSKTDPSFTRQVTARGGYTAISPQYQARIATEQLGPYGQGWGLSHSEFDFSVLETTGMVIHKATFFYMSEGQRYEFPMHNAIKPCHKGANGVYADEDFAKKLETNTISKALSRLGFNADVFMGLFDDHGYVEMVNNQFAVEKADNRDEEIERQRIELQEWYDKNISFMKNAITMGELQGLYKGMVRKLQNRGLDQKIIEVEKVKNQMKTKLEGSKK